jgi:hypothetical protein
MVALGFQFSRMFFGLLFEIGIFLGVGLGWFMGASTPLLHMGKISFDIKVQLP